MHSTIPVPPVHDRGVGDEEETVVSAVFVDKESAYAAVRELREIGISAEDISLLSRDEKRPEDMPTTTTDAAGEHLPVVTDFEVPPDEPLGGSDRLGVVRDGRHEPKGDDT